MHLPQVAQIQGQLTKPTYYLGTGEFTSIDLCIIFVLVIVALNVLIQVKSSLLFFIYKIKEFNFHTITSCSLSHPEN